jgi:hypothetical protein
MNIAKLASGSIVMVLFFFLSGFSVGEEGEVTPAKDHGSQIIEDRENKHHFSLMGIQIGMTHRQVLKVLKPKSNLFQRNKASAHNYSDDPSGLSYIYVIECDEINAKGHTEMWIQVLLQENLPDQPGTSKVTKVHYEKKFPSYERASLTPLWKKTVDELTEKYGKPSQQSSDTAEFNTTDGAHLKIVNRGDEFVFELADLMLERRLSELHEKTKESLKEKNRPEPKAIDF